MIELLLAAFVAVAWAVTKALFGAVAPDLAVLGLVFAAVFAAHRFIARPLPVVDELVRGAHRLLIDPIKGTAPRPRWAKTKACLAVFAAVVLPLPVMVAGTLLVVWVTGYGAQRPENGPERPADGPTAQTQEQHPYPYPYDA